MRLIFTLLLVFAALFSFSQGTPVSGTVSDPAESLLIPGATISFQSRTDSALKKVILTDSSGAFNTILVAGNYRLRISAVGYLTLDSLISIPDTSAFKLPVALLRNSGLLEQVTVTAIPPPVKQKGDTLEYNSSAFRVNPDATAEDMIRKMPGITVEQGAVKAGGEDVKKVTVDGREFFGEDATAALKNLPAEIIEKVQVFDRLSEQAQLTGFEDDNTAKGINIITRSNMRNGQFGRVYAGYGTDNRYSAGGNVSFFNGNRRISLVGISNNINIQNFANEDLLGVLSTNSTGGNRAQRGGQRGGNGGGGQGGGGRGFGNSGNFLVGQQSGISKTNAFGINFSDLWGKKLSVTGSYFFNNSNNNSDGSLSRQYLLDGDSSRFYNENSISGSENTNHRINLRFEYKIDSSNTLIVTPNLSFQNNRTFNTVNGFNTLNPKNIISESGNSNTTTNQGFNFNNNILFRHAFAKRGRSLSLNLTTGINRRDGETYLQALNRSFDDSTNLDDSLRQFSERNGDGYQLSSNISYTEPIGKKGMLQFSYRPSYSENNSDQQTFQYDFAGNKYSLFDSSLSSRFNNRYTTQNGGVNYRFNSKLNNFSVGLAYQHAGLESAQEFPQLSAVNRTFANLLPTAMWNSKLSPKSSLRISYRTNTSAPSVNQLQGVINNSNPLFLRTGNPDLEQQYSHNVITRYNFTNTAKSISLLANVFLQKTENYIGNSSLIALSDSVLSPSVTLYQGSQLVKPVNLDGYWNLRSFVTLGLPLKFIKSNLNWNGGYSYSELPGLINGVNNLSANQTFNAGAVLASNISEFVDFTISYSANFNTVRNSIQPQLNSDYFSQSAGIRLNLLSKNGWVFENDLNNQSYSGLTDGFNQSFWLWNMSAGKKFLKGNKGEIRLSVFDLLKQNQSIQRNIQETYIEDVQTRVLQQYFMLTFSYKLRSFGGR